MKIFVKSVNKIRSIYTSVVGNAKTIIDISKWQSTYDGSRMFDFGVYETSDGIMIIVKAGQGIYADRRFEYHISEIIPRRIFFGTYHFADTRYSALASARAWAKQILALPDDEYKDATEITRHFLDVENYGFSGKTREYGRTWVRTFLAEVERLCPGIKFGIYTSYYGWKDNIAWMPEIAERDLWIAHYGNISAPSIPTEWFYAGKTWLIWQTCDSCTACGGCGRKYGAASISIDINEFNGVMEAFNEWHRKNGEEGMPTDEYLELLAMIEQNEEDIASNTEAIESHEHDGGTEPPIEPPPEYNLEYLVMAQPNLRLRETPETGAVIVGMPYGATVWVTEGVAVPDSAGRGYWVPTKYQTYEGWTADWYLKKK